MSDIDRAYSLGIVALGFGLLIIGVYAAWSGHSCIQTYQAIGEGFDDTAPQQEAQEVLRENSSINVQQCRMYRIGGIAVSIVGGFLLLTD